MAKSKDFAKSIQRQLAADPVFRAEVEKERLNSEIAVLIFEARSKAGLTQAQLAERIGTHQSVIARLEDAEYDGHSLTTLFRVGHALGQKLRLGYEPLEYLGATLLSEKRKCRQKKLSS